MKILLVNFWKSCNGSFEKISEVDSVTNDCPLSRSKLYVYILLWRKFISSSMMIQGLEEKCYVALTRKKE